MFFKRCEFYGTPPFIPGHMSFFEECLFNVVNNDLIPPEWACIDCIINYNDGQIVKLYGYQTLN